MLCLVIAFFYMVTPPSLFNIFLERSLQNLAYAFVSFHDYSTTKNLRVKSWNDCPSNLAYCASCPQPRWVMLTRGRGRCLFWVAEVDEEHWPEVKQRADVSVLLVVFRSIVQSEEKLVISASWAKDDDISRLLKSLPNWMNMAQPKQLRPKREDEEDLIR